MLPVLLRRQSLSTLIHVRDRPEQSYPLVTVSPFSPDPDIVSTILVVEVFTTASPAFVFPFSITSWTDH